MKNKVSGSCLCGKVAFSVSGPFEAFHWCHCSRCRKDSGSAHASNIFAGRDSVEWMRGEELVKRFELAEAKRFSKAFCTNCGSPVPYLTRNGAVFIVPAGTLNDDPGISPDDNIHWKSRAPWYEAGVRAKRFEENPAD